MSKDFQHISRSQFVLTYGPGSLIETKKGPRLIPSLDRGLGVLFNNDIFMKFEIGETRISKYIKNWSGKNQSIRILALPTNAGLGRQNNYRIYSTYMFPLWKICYGRKAKHNPVLYNDPECPICNNNDESSAVRFVSACSDGHLDEVYWNYAVHKNHTCKPKYFYWKAFGSSLSDIIIECPVCRAKNNMKDIYKMNFSCTGRVPEQENPLGAYSPYCTHPNRPKNCKNNMKIMQRQSTSLRVPETITLLTIPEFDTQISRIIQRHDVSIALDTMMNLSQDLLANMGEEKFIEWIFNSLKGRVSEESLDVINKEIRKSGIDDFCNLYKRLNQEDQSFIDLMYEEFESLISGAGNSTDNFEMSHPIKIISTLPMVPDLLVHKISRIRTITVQLGYKRIVSQSEDEESLLRYSGVYLPSDGSIWYPAYEGFGEGIFITFSDGKFPDISSKPAYKLWEEHGGLDIGFDSKWTEVIGKPEFAWLHTFSHSIIRALSLNTGYSSASLRERVYISRDGRNGGILIYNTSPGEDGGMGGLVGTVDKFENIIKSAIENTIVCSNDPLCSDVTKSSENMNGAACYSCLLISETSCEHRNFCLDRHLFTGD